MPKDWIVSQNANFKFSKDGSKMLFGIAPKPLIQDSTILDDEIVNVEVWSYTDQVLYTQQEVRSDREKKRTYDCAYNTINGKIIQIESINLPNVQFDKDLEHNLSIGIKDLLVGKGMIIMMSTLSISKLESKKNYLPSSTVM